MVSKSSSSTEKSAKASRAKTVLSGVAFFLGELRDGLTMINMQNAFLVTSKYYTEKQAGMLFFVFGMSQFLAQTPAGYLMDKSDRKVTLLGAAAVGTTLLTITTALFAQDYGANLSLMIVVKFFQGTLTALIPPSLNSITQGIVGNAGMTSQVSRNEIMNHLGTSIIVLSGSLLAFTLYPDIGMLFMVSPIACMGVVCFLTQIRPGDIDHDVARGLKSNHDHEATTHTETESSHDSFDVNPSPPKVEMIQVKPTCISNENVGSELHGSNASFKNGTIHANSTSSSLSTDSGIVSESCDGGESSKNGNVIKTDSPFSILRDPTLMIFVIICFTFHLSNATVLPLVMQTLAISNGRTGILMSGLCIIIAQAFMMISAKICGTYSSIYGQKTIFIIGIISLPIRCAILTLLLHMKENDDHLDQNSGGFIDYAILSTQILDGMGAGVFGTMYVLVTSNISEGTGRFSLALGITTSAASIGGTVSGYLGQVIAQDMGYEQAFMILGFISFIPVCLYLFFMPRTKCSTELPK